MLDRVSFVIWTWSLLNSRPKKIILWVFTAVSFVCRQGLEKRNHSHKIRQDILKTRDVCWYFHLNLKYLGCSYKAFIETAKNGNFCEELPSENGSEAVLATFCCYDHGAKASEEAQKIAADKKEYHKCSSCVIIFWIAKIYLSINSNEKRLVTKTLPT